MRDRTEQILQLVCLVLAALVVVEIGHAILRVNLLKGVTVPPVPTLVTKAAANTNLMMNGTTNSGLARTNAAMTNLMTVSNSVAMTNHAIRNTNGTPDTVPPRSNAVLQHAETVPGAPTNFTATTNLVSINAIPNTNSVAGTNFVVTNSVATNHVATNAPAVSGKHHSPRMMGGGMNFGRMMGMAGGGATALPPLIQARVDQIVNSEIFAPVMHPQPMALLGIAGDTIFLRTDSGQSGLVKIGDSLGNVKLLRIGINRVLVEQDGQKKELTIFNGYGSDSLLSTKDESSK